MLHGSLPAYVYSHCYQMMTQAWPKATQWLLKVSEETQFFSQLVLLPGGAP